jgi:hypothetical protein
MDRELAASLISAPRSKLPGAYSTRFLLVFEIVSVMTFPFYQSTRCGSSTGRSPAHDLRDPGAYASMGAGITNANSCKRRRR